MKNCPFRITIRVLCSYCDAREISFDQAGHSFLPSNLFTEISIDYGFFEKKLSSIVASALVSIFPQKNLQLFWLAIPITSLYSSLVLINFTQFMFNLVVTTLASILLLLRRSFSRFSFHQGVRDFSLTYLNEQVCSNPVLKSIVVLHLL